MGRFSVLTFRCNMRIMLTVVNPGVAQLVERVVWDHEAAGSNPVTRSS